MKEISLNILDLAQNSIEAGARNLIIEVLENQEGYLIVSLTDDGCGMDEDFLREVKDPFKTTRTTRKVGLGIPLLEMNAKQSGGEVKVTSIKGEGTVIVASFEQANIDRPPLGKLSDTVEMLLITNPSLHLIVNYTSSLGEFVLDSKDIHEGLGPDIRLDEPSVYIWLSAYLKQEFDKVITTF